MYRLMDGSAHNMLHRILYNVQTGMMSNYMYLPYIIQTVYIAKVSKSEMGERDTNSNRH